MNILKENTRSKLRQKQTDLFARSSKSYGGQLLNTRKGRSQGRPISTAKSIHMVLRSSMAVGTMAFNHPRNAGSVRQILTKFAKKYGVSFLSIANVGTHLHFHLKISHRPNYYRFIRAVTAAIAMHVTGRNRWTAGNSEVKTKFWDYRPFTRIIESYRAFLTLKDYIQINQLEGFGIPRVQARWMVEGAKNSS